MKEIVVISGKGGTGKTSLLASFAALSRGAVIADCDVDAADLHLVLGPKVIRREKFYSGNEAVIRQEVCRRCGTCREVCQFGAVVLHNEKEGAASYEIDPFSCEGCGVCVRFCPAGAIDFPERFSGEWFVSETRYGTMVHARLGVAAENSGKLVSLVRREAREIAEKEHRDLLLVDGPPGIGCPVIATLTGATAALVVTEPTPSGHHDMMRVLELAAHFHIPAAVSVNRWDINPDMTAEIEGAACRAGATVAGRVRYDPVVTEAQRRGRTVVETGGGAAEDIRDIWSGIEKGVLSHDTQ
ncbi:MAG TPA: ATP-binding protein [Candidatus Sumerlaeota bacterium]|nr:ATP-binding protein [Candidatus Sumerlaeota bacterium]